jgi:hypothetical protein
MFTGAAIVSVMLLVVLAPVESVTFKVTVFALAPVGVPEMTPAVEIARPAGRFVPVVVHV